MIIYSFFFKKITCCLGILLFGAFLNATAAQAAASSDNPQKSAYKMPGPDLIHCIQFKHPIEFSNTVIPIDQQDVKYRLEKELLLALWDRPQVILWLKRAGRYLGHIEKILKEHNIPIDYKYVPVVESALRPHAGSSRGAIGFWQFLKGTGKKHGLKINFKIDERRNFLKSTHAASRYILHLKSMFKSDFLVLAAYNMGEYGLKNEIKIQKNNDFFTLYLPIETQRYIFKLIAVKLILENPQHYGFHLAPSDIYPALLYDKVNFATDQEIPLLLIARAAGTHFKQIKDMNPEIRGYYLASGRHEILIPKGSARNFKQKFDAKYKSWEMNHQSRLHVVEKGESLTGIAKKYHLSLGELLRLNNFSVKKVIHPGDRLLVE